MYHWVIGLGVAVGLGEILLIDLGNVPEAAGVIAGDGLYQTVALDVLGFFGRLIGTCAVFYGFFLCRMLGAGDIKLMAVCVGNLGVQRGARMIFFGMSLALLTALFKGKAWKNGWLLIRGRKMRLAPYLFAGYCLLLVSGFA